MGFLGLIPASHLAAAYNVRTHKLTLSASGSIHDTTYGISFHRTPVMGGLKFLLEGWTGPFTEHQSTYTHSQDFDIQLPNPATPSGTVIVVDATYPNGKVVPIHFLGGIVPPHLEPRADEQKSIAAPVRELSQAPASAESQSVLAPPQHVTVAVLGQAFGISEAADVTKFGSVHVRFDAEFVALMDAGIEGANVVWSFVGKRVGSTQVVVTVAGGMATFVMVKVHDVRIVFLGEGGEGEGERK